MFSGGMNKMKNSLEEEQEARSLPLVDECTPLPRLQSPERVILG